MTAFLWTLVVLYGHGILFSAYLLGSGKSEKPLSRGQRAIVLVLQIVMAVWTLKLLGVL